MRPSRACTGRPIASLRIAVSERRRDRDGEGYTDTPSVFYSVTVFGPATGHAAESLRTGDPVLVTGRTYIDQFTGSDGETRTTPIIETASLRFTTVTPTGDPRPNRPPPTAPT